MSLSRLDNFLKSIRGTTLYVDPNSLDATDSIENQGNSLVRPFKTIQRALLEASRYSYQRGFDNDRFEKTSIIIYPGEHLIDNRPGWIPDGTEPSDPTLRRYRLRGGGTSNNFYPFDGTTNFNLETNENELYKLNSIYGGVIVPRGVSLIGIDLRKTKIRPKYVPNPENDNIERSAIFRLTGACFIWNFTIFDALPSGQSFQDYTNNKRLPNYSHNKLTVFEYADGKNPVSITDQFYPNGLTYDKTDLDMYYEKVSIAYGSGSGRGIEPTYPESGVDIQSVGGEYEIVGSKGKEYIVDSIIAGDGTTTSSTVTVTLETPFIGVNVNTAIRIEGVPTPGYNGTFVVSEIVDPFTIRYKTDTSPLLANPDLSGFTVTLSVVVDTVNSASPYIFNVSLRSVYGMCGLHADGDKADGFKSIVVAQFTGVGLQKDNNAFVKFDSETGIYEDSTLVTNLSSNSRSRYKPKYENYHIKASNDAFMQLVSVFAIGFANQFIAESGGDLSITNSNSNFGSKALVTSGFRRSSFPQDDVGYITHIIPPKKIENDDITLNYLSIDVGLTESASAGAATTTRLYLYQETNQDLPPISVVDGYRIGSKIDDELFVIINDNEISTIVSSRITMEVPSSSVDVSSVKTYRVDTDLLTKLPEIENNIVTLKSPHHLKTGEKIRMISSIGFLPTGIDNNDVYYAITSPEDPTLTSTQIKIAKSFNDAIGNSPIDINNRGQFLNIESRVSDKLPGEIGHPIQWDSTRSNWYITVDKNNNDIFDSIKSLGVSELGNSTSRTFLIRTPDDRNLIDTVYRLRYVIPKDAPITARPPIDGYILQESNDVIGATDAEIFKYFNVNNNSSISESNPYEIKNFRFISGVTWSGGVATFKTELPHNLSVLSEVEIKNVKSTNNTNGLENLGFNGNFVVTKINDSKSFDVQITKNPGTFTNNTSIRTTLLPFFRRKKFKNTYSIYQSKEIQEYVKDRKDGIYHIFVTLNSISPEIEPFSGLKLSQPIINFYPQKNRDNPKSDFEFSRSYALPDTIGKVVINNPESSITKESLEKIILDSNIGFGITSIQSDSTGIAHTIFTEIDHGLNRITKLNVINSGTGYGTGLFVEETFYNVSLTGSLNGKNATAVIKVNSGSISSIRLMDGGSAYEKDEILILDDIPTTTGFSAAELKVGEIYNDINLNLQIDGIYDENLKSYNNLYRVSSVPNSKEIEVTSVESIITENNFSNIDYKNIQTINCTKTGESLVLLTYSYDSQTGILQITTTKVHGLKVDNKVIISTATNSPLNGEFIVKKINSLSSFDIFVGKGLSISVTNTVFINKPSFKSSSGGLIVNDNEEFIGRLQQKYDNLITTLNAPVSLDDEQIFLKDLEILDLKLGDYLMVDYEIMRVKEDLSNNPLDPVKVFRNLLGTTKKSHQNGSYVERIKVFPIEFRRHSIIRASGHTFEYVGYGPGNYSTTLPERQDRVLSKSEESLAQSLKLDGGLNVYTGMNDLGSFYIGNKRILSSTGKEEIFDAPIPTITGEDPTVGTENVGLNIVLSDEVRVTNALRVDGGPNQNTISEFGGPVVFNNKVKSNSDIESRSLFIKGSTNVSRNYSVGIATPSLSGNPGDITFDANPKDGGDLGWIYTTNNRWQKFGLIKLNNSYNGNFTGTFSGTFTGNVEGLVSVSDVWVTNSVGIHTSKKVGINKNTANSNFGLSVGGGIDVSGNSILENITIDDLSVTGISTLNNNLTIKTTSNNTDGRYIRFVQSDNTISLNQIYGGIEWEGFDTNNSGVRGYIRGISEGTSGKFGISIGVQTSGISDPKEALRINNFGNAIFKNTVTAEDAFIGNLTGIASTSTRSISIKVSPDDTSVSSIKYLTFVGGSTDNFYETKSSTNLTFNSLTGNLTVSGSVTANSDEKLKENVKTIENALEKVSKLRGVEFDYKETGTHQIGLIAQEVEKIIPEVVYGDEIKSVAYQNLVGLLIEAIKEQQKEIDELKKKIK